MAIIGFTGLSRSGKDTAAAYVGWPRVAFADELKWAVCDLWGSLGVREREYYDEHPEERTRVIPHLGMHWVDLLIAYGNAMRAIEPDIWIRLAQPLPAPCVVSDVRFPNEARWIREQGGVIVRVERDGAVRHGSDGLIAGADFVIRNDGTLKDLKKKVAAVREWYCNVHLSAVE